jgi:hypothetical protein
MMCSKPTKPKRLTRYSIVALGGGLALIGLPEVSHAHHPRSVAGGTWDWLGPLVLVLVLVVVFAVSASRERRKTRRSHGKQRLGR